MNEHPLAQAIAAQTGYSIDQLLAPISTEQATGESLRYSELYQQIKNARSQDDSSIPRGDWEYELKQANWQQVAELCAGGLAGQSKDLQLAVWLLEAQVQRFGMAGLAPSLLLIDQLCQHYWQDLHPQQDMDYRNNILSWANSKLQPLLFTLPLSSTGRDEISWEDLENATRNEQIRAANPRERLEGLSMNDCQHAMSATDTQYLVDQFDALDAALVMLDQLTQTLDSAMQDDAPSLQGLTQLLEQIGQFLYSELQKRGFNFDQPSAADVVPINSVEQQPQQNGAAPAMAQAAPVADAGASRTEAYAQLSEIAEYLAHLEPHSPVPYLLKRMVEWGNMTTSELYEQLFVTGQGKINIFEVLGLDKNAA